MRAKLPLAVLFMTACSSHSSLNPGSTSFITDVANNYGGVEDGAQAGASATPTTGPTKGTSTAPNGRTGTVQEADIYRIDGNRLFYFDTYRGFMVYDLANVKNPKLVSRLPVYGYPVEMYVDGNTVYALLRDSLYMTQEAGQARFVRHDTSQLVSIDVTDAAHPKVLKTIDIVGELKEGVSRKIDDTIYVVSSIPQGYYGYGYYDWGWYGNIDTTKEQAWVYSFNVADAKNPALVDKLQVFEGGDQSTSTDGSYSGRYFQNVAISATSNTLHVVENWNTYGWVANAPNTCGSYTSQDQAVVSVIDISDPTGKISLHTKFSTYGHLSDQFKQTYAYDPATQHGYYYGIFDRQEWSDSNCQGTSLVQNSFETWDVTDGANPKRTGSVQFGPGETLGGSTFDLDHKVAYAVTSKRVDPFFAISFADPAAPKVLSSIDGLAGSMSVFRFVDADKKFILGIGSDPSTECNGTQNNWWGTGVSVSLFDVHDPSAVRLVQRACVDIKDAQWVSSDVNFDLDQGHKMIGDANINGVNVVTVPVGYYSRTNEESWWWYDYKSAVGIMSWDLAAYDPAKQPDQQSVITTHGSVEHDRGSVRRTILFSHDDGTGPRRMLLNLSDTSLSVFDIQNLDAPVQQTQVEIAPDVDAIYRFGGYVVEHVRDEGYSWGYDTASRFRVKPVGGSIDDTAPIATFTVGQVQQVVQWKNTLAVFRHKTDPNQATWSYSTESSELVLFDMTDPTHPQLRSITDLGMPLYPVYSYWCGDFFGPWFGWWWGGYYGYTNSSAWVSTDGGIAFVGSQWVASNNGTWSSQLVYIALGDLSAPVVATHDLTHGARDAYSLVGDASDPSAFYLSYRDQVGKPPSDWKDLSHYRYYAQRWTDDGTGHDVKAGDATNVPGQLVRAWRSGDRTLYATQDNHYTWNDKDNYWLSAPRLLLLSKEDSTTASLLDVRTFDKRNLQSLVAAGDRLYLTTSNGWYYDSTAQTPDEQLDHLVVLDTSAGMLNARFDATLGLSGTQAMGVRNDRLFLNVSGGGVLTLDVSDPTLPVGRSFLRTLGWGQTLDISSDTLYVAAGNFGVFQRDLTTATLAP